MVTFPSARRRGIAISFPGAHCAYRHYALKAAGRQVKPERRLLRPVQRLEAIVVVHRFNS
jgi:hypothetical protein